MQFSYYLETLGIIAFAISGLQLAFTKDFDPVGLFVISFVTALGGGTIRDLLLDIHPLYWIKHTEFIVLIFCLSVIYYYIRTYLLSKKHQQKWISSDHWLIVPDAIGLALFTILGTKIALDLSLSPIIIMMIATISACFGGVLRDILCHETPLLFKKSSLYAIPSFCGSGLFLLLSSSFSNDFLSKNVIIILSFLFILSFRLISVKKNLRFK